MTSPTTSLIVEVRPGDRLSIGSPGPDVSIELLHKSGQLARLRITAPKDVTIEKQRARERAIG